MLDVYRTVNVGRSSIMNGIKGWTLILWVATTCMAHLPDSRADYGGSWGNSYSEDSYPRYYPRNSDSYQIISIDLNPQNSLNSSLRIAAREDRFADLKKFLEQGAHVDSQSSTGETALMYAARNCSPKMGSLLLQHSAKVNIRDGAGRTALIFASLGSCVEMVDLLLRIPGIEMNVTDRAKKSALEYASDNSVFEVGGPSQAIVEMIGKEKRRRMRSTSRSKPPSEISRLKEPVRKTTEG